MMEHILKEDIIVERLEDGEAVAYDLTNENTYLFNDTALYVLDCFGDQGDKIELVKAKFFKRYNCEEVQIQTLEKDFDELIGLLVLNKILVQKI